MKNINPKLLPLPDFSLESVHLAPTRCLLLRIPKTPQHALRGS